MNVTESKDVQTLVRWLVFGGDRTAALNAAVALSARAHKTLGAGLSEHAVSSQFPAEPSNQAAKSQILQLEEAVLASYELVFDEVPAEPKGLESWYSQNLYEMAEDIKARRAADRG